MKKHKELLLWIIFGVLVVFVLTPLFYWLFNPEMTTMQITIKFWYLYVLVVVIYIFNQKLLKL